MKIALLYSGQLRTFAETIATNLAYFKACGATHIDVYCCITNNVGYSNNLNDFRHVCGSRALPGKPFITIGDLEEIIAPHLSDTVGQGTCVVKTIPFKLPNGETDIWESHQHFFNHNLITQYYLMQECINMVGEKVLRKYDMLVRMRMDVELLNKIECSNLQAAAGGNQLIVNKYVWQNHQSNSILNEMFFMGNPYIMFKACRVYSNLQLIQQQIQHYPKNGFEPYGESIFKCHLVLEELDTQIIEHDFNYRVLR